MKTLHFADEKRPAPKKVHNQKELLRASAIAVLQGCCDLYRLPESLRLPGSSVRRCSLLKPSARIAPPFGASSGRSHEISTAATALYLPRLLQYFRRPWFPLYIQQPPS